MTMTLDGTNGVTFNDTSLQGAAASPYGLKNRIINGAMVIDQRNAGASVSITTSANLYTLDRWQAQGTVSSGVYTVQRSATAPSEFVNSFLATVTTADASLAAGDLYAIGQFIEGSNVVDLGWGTASAKTVTISFWVRSSVTGTFGGSVANSAYSRSYPFTYTISTANTFEYKTITIAGDTTGTWLTDTGIGVRLYFGLGTGSSNSGTAGAWAAAGSVTATGATNLVATNGATFYITGVQLEQNTVATPFERRLYNQELANCQRYYYRIQSSNSGNRIVVTSGLINSTTACIYCSGGFPVTMRTSPTSTQSGLNINDSLVTNTVTSISNTTSMPNGFSLSFSTGTATLTSGKSGYIIGSNNLTDYLDFSAEL